MILTKSKKPNNIEIKKILLHDEFIGRTNQRNLFNKIKELVEITKEVYNEDLEKKRLKLKALLNSEECYYQREIINYFKMNNEQDKLRKLESLRAFEIEKEKEKEEFVKMKKIQAILNNNDDIRFELRKNILNETKKIQLLQIEDKKKQKMYENDENILWLKVRQKIMEEEEKRQKYEDDLRKMILKEEQMEQIQFKQALEERKKRERLMEIEERLKNEAQWKAEQEKFIGELNFKKEQKNKQVVALKEQLQKSIELKKQKEKQEEEFEKQFNNALQRQIKYEEQALKAKVSDLKLSILKYLEYCNEVKKERELEQMETEAALEEYTRKTQCEQLKKVNAIREKKAEEAKKVYEELLQQIHDNEQRRLRECQEELKKDLEQQERDEQRYKDNQSKVELKKKESMMKYRQQLLEQIEQVKIFNAEKKKQYQEEIKRAEEEDDFRQKLAEKIIKEKISFLPEHPNWKLICCSCID